MVSVMHGWVRGACTIFLLIAIVLDRFSTSARSP